MGSFLPGQPAAVAPTVAPTQPGARPQSQNQAREQAESDVSTSRLVRPYTVTGGRLLNTEWHTRLEALVSPTKHGFAHRLSLPFEHRRIIDLILGGPIALVEIAARLQLPIGIVQVLIHDMSKAGTIKVHAVVDASDIHSVDHKTLLQEALDGIRRL
jgi:hypothetical protein